MNIKEKIKFIASSDYVSKLHESNLDFENHNRLFWCHLAAMSFLTSGISNFNLNLSYSYLLNSGTETKEQGLIIDFQGISFFTTNNALIQINNNCTRNGLTLNNPILGHLSCFSFKNSLKEYITNNIKVKKMTLNEYSNATFNSLSLKFRIHQRRSEETQLKFMKFLHEECAEIDYFINYLNTKDILNSKKFSPTKKFKI